MHPQQQWQPLPYPPPQKRRRPLYVIGIAVGGLALLAVGGLGGWFVGSQQADRTPAAAVAQAAPTEGPGAGSAFPSPSTRAYDVETLKSCTAATGLIDDEPIPADDDLVSLIQVTRTSGEPGLRRAAGTRDSYDRIGLNQIYLKIIAWCDRHNVNFKPDKED